VSAGGLAYEPFDGSRGRLWMMRIGAVEAPPILFVPALFEEMNRTRALVAATMRALAGRGFGCWLADLTGTGESEAALAEATWRDWRHDVSAASNLARTKGGAAPLLASVRGGALIDDGASAIGRWRLTPVDGSSLTRDMERSGFGGGEWAGYAASADVKGFLADARPYMQRPLRVVRLASDPGEADHKIEGPALWRRSEPGGSAELAEAMAADIAQWHATCAGC
jgi:hypothetical protein